MLRNLKIALDNRITDEEIKYLKKIKKLDIQHCFQLTEETFNYEPISKIREKLKIC
jgi:hypothetical protein